MFVCICVCSCVVLASKIPLRCLYLFQLLHQSRVPLARPLLACSKRSPRKKPCSLSCPAVLYSGFRSSRPLSLRTTASSPTARSPVKCSLYVPSRVDSVLTHCYGVWCLSCLIRRGRVRRERVRRASCTIILPSRERQRNLRYNGCFGGAGVSTRVSLIVAGHVYACTRSPSSLRPDCRRSSGVTTCKTRKAYFHPLVALHSLPPLHRRLSRRWISTSLSETLR